MRWIGTSGLVDMVRLYRVAWIAGHYGGGKTSFAVALAEEFLRRGYRLVSNINCVWNEYSHGEGWPDFVDESGHLRVVVLVDEGGHWLSSTAAARKLVDYAAKMDIVYLFPSFSPVSKYLQVVTFQPVASFFRVGLPWRLFRWYVRLGDIKEKGWFLWLDPTRPWGLYSRQDPGADIDELEHFLLLRYEEYRRWYDYRREKMNRANPTKVLVPELEVEQNAKGQDLVEYLEQQAQVTHKDVAPGGEAPGGIWQVQ